MRAPNLAMIVVALIVGSMAVLLVISSTSRQPETRSTASLIGGDAGSVSGNGFTLTSTSIEPPADDATFPAGPHVDLVNQNCLSCHSASMVLTQPRLKPEQWTAIVEKMRDVYKAPIAAGDVPAITAYLAGLGAGDEKPGD
ncbi:hypothetical protein [Sphingomonas radiodurans]|uniref:hypothetical protein n=1 Tax=Sphingomonas radiodurans TaxID=2890321 RepID=UPI001E323E81|nr:hypothetical protein [Sphingomonas radiodurans]WBH15764.1 hypothetical protein LLW23_13190 [Sphingomonas radiodurans]